MTDQTKRCTKCGESKPLAEFYLRRATDPRGPRRASCKACDAVEGQRRRSEGESVIAEIIRVGTSRPELLSERARAAAFPDNPIPPEAWAAYHARQAKEARRQKRAARQRPQEVRPMRFARMEIHA